MADLKVIAETLVNLTVKDIVSQTPALRRTPILTRAM